MRKRTDILNMSALLKSDKDYARCRIDKKQCSDLIRYIEYICLFIVALFFVGALGKCLVRPLSRAKPKQQNTIIIIIIIIRRAANLHTIRCQLFHKRRLLYTRSHGFSLFRLGFPECFERMGVNGTKQRFFAVCDW